MKKATYTIVPAHLHISPTGAARWCQDTPNTLFVLMLRRFGPLQCWSQQSVGDFYILGASALSGPTAQLHVVCHFEPEVLSFPNASFAIIQFASDWRHFTTCPPWWHRITVPHSNSASSLERRVRSQLFVQSDSQVLDSVRPCAKVLSHASARLFGIFLK